MNAFDTRLLNNLFPEMPESFEKSVQKALKKTGVEKHTVNPWRIVSVAVAVAAVAASFVLVLTSAFRTGQRHEASPDGTALTGMQTADHTQPPVPLASAEPDWMGNTEIFAAVSSEGRYTEEDTDRYGKAILSFLRELGESEPDELWILRVRSTDGFLPADDSGNYMSCVLVLAQSRFDVQDGPDLYCIQNHPDGEVLWGTIDCSPGPHRVLASVYGQQRWMFYGSNTMIDGESLGHVKAGYLTGGEPGTDIEFSAFLSTDAERAPFKTSRHFQRLSEYYLVTDGEPDPNAALDLSLMLVTSDSSYAFPIRDEVMEVPFITAQQAEEIRTQNDALETIAPTEEPYTQPYSTPTAAAGAVTVNLTDLSDAFAMPYTDAVLAWLRLRHDGVEPDMLWICAVAPFAFPEEAPTDEAYVLAQYEFNGETGPELFFVKDGTVLWQTFGYDPFCINTVYDPIKDQNAVFGASPYYDNGPVPVKEAQLSLESEDGSVSWATQDGIGFRMELPLADVLTRLNGQHSEWASEFFICPYPKNMKIIQISFTAQNEDVYCPDVKTVNHLVAHTASNPNP